MGIVTLPSFGTDPATVNAANLDGKVDPLATEFNGGIDNDNIASDAAIANSKLNLASISQNIAHSGTMTHSGVVTLSAATTMNGKDFTEAKGADVASAATCTIWVTDGNFIHITGTTTITSFGTAAQAGDERTIVFDGALTLTHNATSLILPTGANITTAAGDTAIVRAETTTNARVIAYLRKDGTAVAATSITAASQSEMEAATNNTKTVTPLAVNWHPGVAKCWVLFDGTGTPAVTVSHNIDSSITDNGTGDWTVAVTTDFSSANWAFAGMCNDTTEAGFLSVVGNPAAGTLRIVANNHDGVDQDKTKVSVVGFGDQ